MSEEVMDLGFNAFEAWEWTRFHLFYSMCLLLKNDAAEKLRVLLLQGYALMTHCSTNVHEKNSRVVCVLTKFLSEVDHVEHSWQTITLSSHPWKEELHHFGVRLQPGKRGLIRTMAKLPWAVIRICGIDIACLT